MDQRPARSSRPGRLTDTGWKPYRSRHRERNDDASHTAASRDLPPVLDHDLVFDGDPELVTTADQLADLLEHLRAAGQFGYDSEFIGEQSYHPTLCVIQLATPQRIALVDALSGLDLAPLWQLLAAPEVEVIVHAGEQDLEPVVRHTGRAPQRIVDAQLMAGFCGLSYPLSLGNLAKALLDASLGPGLKFSQWDRRPLTDLQLAYAANDVRYLPLLRQALLERLDALGNTRFALAACAELSDPKLYTPDPQKRRLRVKGLSTLSRKQMAVLEAMKVWREQAARHEDLPPRALLPDQVLFNLAAHSVNDEAELGQIKGLPSPIRRIYGEQIVQQVAQALSGPLPKQPRPLRPRDDAEKQAMNDLWQAVKQRCEQRQVAVGTVTNRAEVTAYFMRRRLGKSVEHLPLATGWRAELLDDALALPQ